MIPAIHKAFVDKAIEEFKKDSRILGVAAGGSYIAGAMDEFSDIDLVIAVAAAHFEQVMAERKDIAGRLGTLLSAFTGEHVGEPRLLICLYGPPLLHVDLKFVSENDFSHRVEDPAVLWERSGAISKNLKPGEAKYPEPDMQWIEDRFWVWVHYVAGKIGRRELFEAIESLSFLRQNVLGPLILIKEGRLPRGVRKIETDAPAYLPGLKETLAAHSAHSCAGALKAAVGLYNELREALAPPSLIRRTEAEKYSKEYLEEISERAVRG